jgi:hypothetical protein
MNTDILVLSSAYTSDPSKWKYLRESAENHKVPLHVLGQGQPFPGMGAIQNGIEFLKTRSEEYVVITDAYDVIVNRWDENEVRMLIDSAPSLIMSVEPKVWPPAPELEAPYAHLAGRYKWYAINGGQYAGRRQEIIAVWQGMMARWDAGQARHGGSSQEILHRMFADQRLFTLDLECRLFQTMIGEEARYVYAQSQELADYRACNSVTYTRPMFLHFNGQGLGLSPGLDEWARILI